MKEEQDLPNHMGWKWGALGNVLGNTMGTWRTYWEHHEKSLGTLWQLDENIVLTSWELIENLIRTHWEQEENEKSLHLHSLQTQKIHRGHVEPSHWLHAIFIFKIVGHIFWHRLLAAAKKLRCTQILAHILGGTYCDLR
jgi:hypothetical protein